MSDAALMQETQSIKQSLSTIDARIEQARRELTSLPPYSEEKDIWETNLVMLQVKTLVCIQLFGLNTAYAIEAHSRHTSLTTSP